MVNYYKKSKIYKIKISETTEVFRDEHDGCLSYFLKVNGRVHPIARAIFESFFWDETFKDRECGLYMEGINENYETVKEYKGEKIYDI